jgi:peptidoglycan/xylan/chitin deacetylase (PgdA/CDA1 family)
VLDELKKYNAQATFFCIGKNVELYPDVCKRIIDEGHAVGNHTYGHLNGWKTADEEYLNDIENAKKIIDSNLFRPPYGRISKFQLSQLSKPRFKLKTVMWSVLSGDFDVELSKESCRDYVLMNAESGSIVVFHDSEKASERMQFALPEVLKYFSKRDFQFKKIIAEI